MAHQDEVSYDRRPLGGWVERAWAGEVTIADFQRSFVWDPSKATAYIKAILLGKPVGLYMILKSSEDPQFQPRQFSQMDTPLGGVKELVLDGQQRLTSLLHALYGHPQRRFFIEVSDLSDDELDIVDVICESKNPSTGNTGKGLDVPSKAYERNLIPIDILRKTGPRVRKLSPLANWCIAVGNEVDGLAWDEIRLLEDRISNFVDKCLFQRNLWYCLLPETTDAEEATDIFVETNTSSVRIKRFDIEVAKARGKHDEDLRNTIQDAYDRSGMLRFYFSEDPEEYIPAIGEWILKVVCLHIGQTPKESNFKNAVMHLVRDETTTGRRQHGRMKDVLEDLDFALRRAEQFGAAAYRMVPSWPTLHVMAALRQTYKGIGNPAKVDRARRLLEAYYWRSLFSNRYDVRANDRLHEDYGQLKAALLRRGKGKGKSGMSAFDAQDHPLYDREHLIRHAGWIGSSRLGRALAAAVLSRPGTVDWITGEQLDAPLVRELEGGRDLDHHHIFPKDALRKGGMVQPALVNHGLNGVVLDRRTNLKLWKDAPHEYVEKILHEEGISRTKLGKRIAGHLVPFEELTNDAGGMKRRYDQFLQARAAIFSDVIQKLAARPDQD